MEEVKRPSVADLSRAFSGHMLNAPSGMFDSDGKDLTGRRRPSRTMIVDPKAEAARGLLSNGVRLPGADGSYNLAKSHPLIEELRRSQEHLLEDIDDDDDDQPAAPGARALVDKVKTRMTDDALFPADDAGAAPLPGAEATGPGGVVDERTWVADWFIAKCDDATVQKTLDSKPTGTFLVRQDPRSDKIFHLSFRAEGRTQHRRLRATLEGVHFERSDLFFDCISDLVFHFSAPWSPENKDLPCALKLVSREELAAHAERYGAGAGGAKRTRVLDLGGQLAKPGEPWKVKDVVNWLKQSDLGRYAPEFEAKKIDGLALLKLQAADLARLGFDPAGADARKLMEEVAKLSAQVLTGSNHDGQLRRKTFAVKKINGRLKVFDTATGEEIHEIGASLLHAGLADFLPNAAKADTATTATSAAAVGHNAFEWHGPGEGWLRYVGDVPLAERDWTTNDLCDWLNFVGLPDAARPIREKNIDCTTFKSMGAQLLRDMGEQFGLRDKLVVANELLTVKARGDRFGRDEHLGARWFHPNIARSDARSLVLYEPSQAFCVFADDDGAFGLAYNADGNVHDTTILPTKSGDKLFLADAPGVKFDTLCALVHHHGLVPGPLHTCLTIPAPSSHSVRSCEARIDDAARAAPWFDGAVKTHADAVPRPSQPGQFVVRDGPNPDSLVLIYNDSDNQPVSTIIANNPHRGLHLHDAALFADTLTQLVYTYTGNNSDKPYLLKLFSDKDAHRQAKWYMHDASVAEVGARLQGLPDGFFAVRHVADNQAYQLHYCYQGALEDRLVSTDGAVYSLEGSEQQFASLSALVMFYTVVPTADLPMLLRLPPDDMYGNGYETARSRVDVAALSSIYWIGGVPEEVALDLLEGAFDGAFAVREDLQDPQVLWLNFVVGGQVQRRKIVNSLRGLRLVESDLAFENLTAFVAHHCGKNDDAPYVLRMGWSKVLPSRPPPIGINDHLSAPWFLEHGTDAIVFDLLEFEPAGTFLIFPDGQQEDLYHLQYNYGGKVHRKKVINRPQQGYALEDGGDAYYSVAALVSHHYIVRGPHLHCLLRRPAQPHYPFKTPLAHATSMRQFAQLPGNTEWSQGERIESAVPPPWDQTHANKLEALTVLQGMPTEGGFVVRRSESQPACLTLSYLSGGYVHNELIRPVMDPQGQSTGFFLEKNPRLTFASLSELVEYFALPRAELVCALTPAEALATHSAQRKTVQQHEPVLSRQGSAASAVLNKTPSTLMDRHRMPIRQNSTVSTTRLVKQASNTSMTSTVMAVRDAEWYQLGVSRHQALAKLLNKPDGAFVVRTSESSPGYYILCFVHNGVLAQEFICTKTDGTLALEKAYDKSFPNLESLVAHYQQPQDELPVVLRIFKPAIMQQGSNPRLSRQSSRVSSGSGSALRRQDSRVSNGSALSRQSSRQGVHFADDGDDGDDVDDYDNWETLDYDNRANTSRSTKSTRSTKSNKSILRRSDSVKSNGSGISTVSGAAPRSRVARATSTKRAEVGTSKSVTLKSNKSSTRKTKKKAPAPPPLARAASQTAKGSKVSLFQRSASRKGSGGFAMPLVPTGGGDGDVRNALAMKHRELAMDQLDLDRLVPDNPPDWLKQFFRKPQAKHFLEETEGLDGTFVVHLSEHPRMYAELTMISGSQYFSRQIELTPRGLCFQGILEFSLTLDELIEKYRQGERNKTLFPHPLVDP